MVEGMVTGAHAVCVHEYGDCSDPAFLTAGMHYDPLRGRLTDEEHHVGDLGTLRVDGTGRGRLRIDHHDLTLAEIVGRSVIVHAEGEHGEDHDAFHRSRRAACGVIAPGEESRIASVERELMSLRHYVEKLGIWMASKSY